MNTTLKKDFDKKKGSSFLKSDSNKFFNDKNQISKYPNLLWFKGSRYR